MLTQPKSVSARRSLRSGVLIGLLGMPMLSWALTVGEIQVQSFLNQPFRAVIPLSGVEPGDLEWLKAQLAEDKAFNALGLEKTGFLTGLDFSVAAQDSPDRALVRVSSAQVAREPFFSFLVEFRSLRERLVREYTVLLDPSDGRTARDTSGSAPPPAQVFVPTAPAPVAPPLVAQQTQPPAVVATPRPPAQPVQAVQPVPRAAFQPASPFAGGDNERTVPVPDPEVFEGSQARIAIPRAKPRPSSVTYEEAVAPIISGGQYGPVKKGDTLWTIAAAVRPSSRVTMNQVMWALYSTNETQFDGNLNLVRLGAVLKVPNEQAMINVSPAEANALVADEAARHRALLRGTDLADTPRVAPAARQPERVALEPAPESRATASEAAPVKEQTAQQPAPVQATAAPQRPSQPAAAAKPTQAPPQSAAAVKPPQPAAVELVAPTPEKARPAGPDSSAIKALPGDDDGSAVFADLPDLPSDASADAAATADDDFWSDEAPALADEPEVAIDEPLAPAAFLTDDLVSKWPFALGGLAIVLLAFVGLRRLRAKGAQADEPESGQAAALSPGRAGKGAAAVAAVAAAGAAAQQEEEDDDFLSVLDEVEDTAADKGFETSVLQDELEFAPAGAGSAATEEFDQTAQFDAGLNLDEPAPAAPPVPQDGGTLDLGTETVSLELNEDPLSEADFQLAYGLYDEAALLLNRAIVADPDRIELHEKLAETFFAASNAEQFSKAAEALKAKEPDAEIWQRIAIMGQQLCPNDPLFAGEPGAGADGAVDLDMDFGADEATPAPSAEPESNVLEFDMEETELAPAGSGATATQDRNLESSEDDNLLEFDLGPSEASSGQDGDLDFEADFGDLDMDAESEGDLPELDDLDLGDLEAELDLDGESPAAGTEVAGATASQPDELSSSAELVADEIEDLVGAETDFELDDLPEADATNESLEFELSDGEATRQFDSDTVEVPGGDETDFDLDALDGDAGLGDAADALGTGDAELGNLTDFDLDDLGGAESAGESTDFDLDDLGDAELPGGETDFDLDDLGAADSTGENTDFSLDELDASGTATDFDLDDLGAGSAAAGETTDFDLDALEAELGDSSAETLDKADVSDFEMDFADDTDADTGEIAGGGDEAATKLDLARAYVDMGETDMARGLLEEVVAAGDAAQQADAKELLGQLG